MHWQKPLSLLAVLGLLVLVAGALAALAGVLGESTAVATVVLLAVLVVGAIALGLRNGGRTETPYW